MVVTTVLESIMGLYYLTFGTTSLPSCSISHNNSQEISACDGGWLHWSCDPLQESWRKLGGRRGGCEPCHKDFNNQTKKQHLSAYCCVDDLLEGEMLHNVLNLRGRLQFFFIALLLGWDLCLRLFSCCDLDISFLNEHVRGKCSTQIRPSLLTCD